jgi:hypothetical protein
MQSEHLEVARELVWEPQAVTTREALLKLLGGQVGAPRVQLVVKFHTTP